MAGVVTSGDLVHRGGVNEDSVADAQADMQVVDLEIQLALKSMVTRLLEVDGRRPHLQEVMAAAHNKVNVKNVAQRLQAKNLPADVMALVNSAATGTEEKKKAEGPFEESSLTKAREVLMS